MSFKGSQYLSYIGKGAQATVDKHLYKQEIVAVKSYTSVDAPLLRELYVFQRLKNCENINQMLDIDIGLQGIKIMMNFYQDDLALFILNTPSLTRINLGPLIFNQLLNALYHLHSRNIIHCDIKSENILIHDNNVVLADFGLSSEGGHQYIRGSYAYNAPELLLKHHYTDKIDIWALGVTMVEYYLGSYITDPSDHLHIKYPGEYTKMVALQILSIVTKPNKQDLIIDQQFDHIHVEKILKDLSISKEMIDKLIRMLQLNPHHRASIKELHQSQFCPIVVEMLRRGPMIEPQNYFPSVYMMIEICDMLELSPVTCYRSIELLEKLLANYKISNLKANGTACILLINKLQDNKDIFSELIDAAKITKNELIFTELSILKKMNYMLMDDDNEFVHGLEKLINQHVEKYVVVDQLKTLVFANVDIKSSLVHSTIIYPLLLNMYETLEKENLYPGEMFDFELLDYIQ